MSLVLSGTNGVTFPDSSLQTAAASPYVLKNRLINSDMRIDQRNAGASVTTLAGALTYTLDRWSYYASQASKFTVQQNAGAVTPPVGFSNYLGVTSSSAYTVGSAELFVVGQAIEGYNTADLAWGTANAKTITFSFWVRSSLTGTFGGSLRNSATDRSYIFSYTISTANTWEQKSITITGDTSGTWLTTNGVGIYVYFGLGVGSTLSSTAGAWTAGSYLSATGATSVVGTNGATWYVTGTQLEVGTSATPFERRLYNQELANCQRYCPVWETSGTNIPFGSGGGQCITTSLALLYLTYPVSPRVSATGISSSGTLSVYQAGSTVQGTSSVVFNSSSNSVMQLLATASATNLVAGNSTALLGTNSKIIATGCEL